MQSRFWTFCAASNILLYLFTVSIIYYHSDRSSRMSISTFTRTHKDWVDGVKVWRSFYNGYATPVAANDATYQAFLPVGLSAVGCTNTTQAPTCDCLRAVWTAGKLQCIKAALQKLDDCNFLTKPLSRVEELDMEMKPFALLNTFNVWSMIGSLLIWVRQSIAESKKVSTTPYWLHLGVGLGAALVHCSLLEPSAMIFSLYVIGMFLFTWMTFCHRQDSTWPISTFLVQYLFCVPTYTLMVTALTQKRDIAYVSIVVVLAIIYGLCTMSKNLLEQTKGTDELPMMVVLFYAMMLCLYTALNSMSYTASGGFYFRSVPTVWYLYGLYLGLGMLDMDNIKRVYCMEIVFRVVISASMLTELALAGR